MTHLRESEWSEIVRALEAHLRLQVQAFVRPKEWAFDVTHAARLFDLDALVGDPRPSDTFRQARLRQLKPFENARRRRGFCGKRRNPRRLRL